MTPNADPRPLAATQGDETAVSASTSVRDGSGAQNGAEGRRCECPDAYQRDRDLYERIIAATKAEVAEQGGQT